MQNNAMSSFQNVTGYNSLLITSYYSRSTVCCTWVLLFLLFPDATSISTKHDREKPWPYSCAVVTGWDRRHTKFSSLLRFEIRS